MAARKTREIVVVAEQHDGVRRNARDHVVHSWCES